VVWQLVLNLVPKEGLEYFGAILQWARAACMQQSGTRPQERAGSQLAIQWQTLHMTATWTSSQCTTTMMVGEGFVIASL
jgi:hypothetical protein